MAASGAMADFGRMSVGRKLIILGVIMLFAAFLYHRLAYKKLDEELTKAKQSLTTTKTKSREIDDKIPKFHTLRAKKQILDQTIAQQEKALPTESEVPAFFETLEQKITESGAELVRYTKRVEEPVESFVKVPLDVELVGTFMQIKRFFASLIEKKKVQAPTPGQDNVEERERIVSIENLNISQPTIRNGEIVLSARFTAVTYRQEDAKPVAPTAPGAVPAGSPAPSPAGGGSAPGATPAPPLPSAATPAGAKARVEDSMKKSEERVEKGTTPATGSARLQGGL